MIWVTASGALPQFLFPRGCAIVRHTRSPEGPRLPGDAPFLGRAGVETMTASASSTAKNANRATPVVLYFEADVIGRKALVGSQRFRRLAFEKLHAAPQAECVLITSSERLLSERVAVLKGPNLRVLALSDDRFKDPRLDGMVYAYLPVHTPGPLLERMIENALEHIHLLATRRDANERLLDATREISELNKIGAALSAEHDTAKLLEMILTKSREITHADAGSLYIVEEVEDAPAQMEQSGQATSKRLRFRLAQNDSVAVPFRETTMDISEKSIAGNVALKGEIVNLEDAYRLPENVPFSINRKFDEDSGYSTKSILAVPMRNLKNEVLGVVQLINAKRTSEARVRTAADVKAQVIPFTQRQQELVASLASQAAVALENSRLVEAIQKLFEGFVRASVIAIEARDPTTSGHSFRVANLTVALAETVDRAPQGPYAGVRFTREQMREIRYASLLHDFGKVGVREDVLVKAKKLYPAQLDLIRQRFHFVKRTLESTTARRQLDYLLQKGREDYLAQAGSFDAQLAAQLQELDDLLKVIVESNEPTVLPAGNFERLLEIAAREYEDFHGQRGKLLTDDEVRLLSIRKGSLDESERVQIESHVVHTFKFLEQIPWTTELRGIPGIARWHHEKLNGMGYPCKLSAPEIPLQTRMMTISDIFDALAASDRPYKRAVLPERALEILGYAVKDGEIDSHLFELFLEAKIYDKWKVEPFPY
jgi:HD-GYP domain-containing protein (c-di-GMP phosphodiesterase class II)